ncbi:unnamed protein product, partial [Ixodes persulcatus]
KKSGNVYLVLFPCPGVMLSVMISLCRQCFGVIRQALLLSGDVELNPGPHKGGPSTRSQEPVAPMEQDQSNLISTVNDIKKSQASIENKITDMDRRLIAVESKTSSSDAIQHDLCDLRRLTDSLKDENSRLRVSHAELEDRSRRDNLLFYGLTDSPSESWNQTEEKLMTVVSDTLNLPIPTDSIERAHRLGAFADNKCRPVIVKFLSFKMKQQILFSSAKLKSSGITVSEDYSISTRQARRKLVEFAKTQNSVFKLRYNKLYINSKCYGYN